MSTLMATYAPQNVTFTRGQGAWLFDAEDKRYLDALTGIAVCGLGHAHPAVTEAIHAQSQQLLHTSNHFNIGPQQQLADALCTVSQMDKAFFCNSGAEANEAAIKLARLFGHKVKRVKTPSIIVMEGAFHGRTMATISASGNRKIQAGFEPLVSGFVRAPFDDLEAVRTIGRNNSDVVAVLVEPVQGEGGICVPQTDYLRQLKSICAEFDWLLMLDEIQTGNARTGAYFAYQLENTLPDVVTTAKGLGNGVPIGCCLAQGQAAEVLQPGTHGTTFGGNHLATAAALAVVENIENQRTAERAAQLSQHIAGSLQSLVNRGLVKGLRHKGMMFGLDLGQDCGELVALGLEQGLVINVTAGSIVRLLPPLNLSDTEANQLITAVTQLIEQFQASRNA